MILKATDVMTTDVFTICGSAKVTQAIATMQTQKVRSLIVNKVVQSGAYGIVTDQDIVYKVMVKAADPLHVMVCEIMTSPCLVIEPHMDLPEIARQFEAWQCQQAPVVENNRLLGVVSISDIIQNSNVDALNLPNNWTGKVEAALRHKKLCWGEGCELEQESEVVDKIVEALSVSE